MKHFKLMGAGYFDTVCIIWTDHFRLYLLSSWNNPKLGLHSLCAPIQ